MRNVRTRPAAKWRGVLACLVTATLGVGSPGWAQNEMPTTALLGGGVALEQYHFSQPEKVGVESVSLQVAPVTAAVPILRFASLSLSSAYAVGRVVRNDGVERSISGLTDTRLTLNVPIGSDASISVNGVLPTGRGTQGMDEAEVAGILAADLLPFRVSNWGGGGSVGLGSTVSRALAGFSAGLSVGYTIAQPYRPLTEDERAYQPGDELTLRVAVDRTIRRANKASLWVSLNHYSNDLLDGKNLYRSGNRYSAVGSYAFVVGDRSSAVAYLGAVHRTEGTYLDALEPGPSQNLFIGGGGGRFPVGAVVLVPAVDTRLFRSSDGVDQGYLASVGTALELPLGSITLIPTGRGRMGKALLREGSSSGLIGFELGVMVRYAN